MSLYFKQTAKETVFEVKSHMKIKFSEPVSDLKINSDEKTDFDEVSSICISLTEYRIWLKNTQ